MDVRAAPVGVSDAQHHERGEGAESEGGDRPGERGGAFPEASEGLQAVIDGQLAATVSQGTEDQGKLSADAAADLVEGKTVKPETIVSNVVYTKANAAEALATMK